MEIDRDVVAVAPQPSTKSQILSQTCQAAPAGRHDDCIQVGIVLDDGGSRRLDDVGQVRVWKPFTKRTKGRRRKDDVTDLPKPNQQNLQ